jgi:hypothetical protein
MQSVEILHNGCSFTPPRLLCVSSYLSFLSFLLFLHFFSADEGKKQQDGASMDDTTEESPRSFSVQYLTGVGETPAHLSKENSQPFPVFETSNDGFSAT